MPEPTTPIRERSPEAKRAYLQGLKAGGEQVLGSIRRGLTVQQAEDHFLTMHAISEQTVDRLEGEDR